jgi:hypothetical protein
MTVNITITIEEWHDLRESSEKLKALVAAGVDNWEGYDEAMRILYEEKEGFRGI